MRSLTIILALCFIPAPGRAEAASVLSDEDCRTGTPPLHAIGDDPGSGVQFAGGGVDGDMPIRERVSSRPSDMSTEGVSVLRTQRGIGSADTRGAGPEASQTASLGIENRGTPACITGVHQKSRCFPVAPAGSTPARQQPYRREE